MWNDAIPISIAVSHMLHVALLAWVESDEGGNLVFTSKRLKLLLIIKTGLTLWMKATNPNQISDIDACAMSNGVDHPDL